MQNCFRAVDFPRLYRRHKNVEKCFILYATTSKTFMQMFCIRFVLHVTTSYLQRVFNMLKHLPKMFSKCLATFLQMF